MARAATIGNGSILVGIDQCGLVHDFYFPYVGHSNHVSGGTGNLWHRIGVWVDGNFSWLHEDSWSVTVKMHAKQMSTDIVAVNKKAGITLTFSDVVHNEFNIFLRQARLVNDSDSERTVKLYFAQQFRISESRRGDTGIYDPRVDSVIHYKGNNVFLVHAQVNGVSFKDYSIGIFDLEGKDGTFKDAEDGELECNPVEHGSVDSVLGLTSVVKGRQTVEVNYWVAAGKSFVEAHQLHGYVLTERPDRIAHSVKNYWRLWVEKDQRDISVLPEEIQNLYQKSLEVIRVHADDGGGIIASSDSEMLNQGRDNYSYVWPRDSVVAADALARGGYLRTAERLYDFLSKMIEPDGYLMHKYRVDGVLGSSWHPWIRNGEMRLPIQEDETASILFFLWKHYEVAKNVEFIESLYNSFIEPAAEFLCEYVDEETGLPKGSYDLWEEKYGTSTYTASSVYGGLIAAAEFSSMLGKEKNAQGYRLVAERIQASILQHLYLPDFKTFVKLREVEASELTLDLTIDSSSYFGLGLFGVLPFDDERMKDFREVIDEKLGVGGGYVRYEGDQYYTKSDVGSPNPWIICTMWMAQVDIANAQSLEDLDKVLGVFNWVLETASESGMLAEQIHPETKEHFSASPLVWSHSELVITVDEYLKKRSTFINICD